MVASNTTRASGRTTAAESTAEASQEAEKLPDLVTPHDGSIDRQRRFRSPGLSRMTLDWHKEDSIVVAQAQAAAHRWVMEHYADAYQLISEIYDLVREPELDDNDQPKKDPFGLGIWKLNAYGRPIEDWSKLTIKLRDDFLFAIITALFAWEIKAQDAWADAMNAKALWEGKYADSFSAPIAGTIEDRDAKAKSGSMEERYFSILLTHRSKLCESIVRTMTNLAQVLKSAQK